MGILVYDSLSKQEGVVLSFEKRLQVVAKILYSVARE